MPDTWQETRLFFHERRTNFVEVTTWCNGSAHRSQAFRPSACFSIFDRERISETLVSRTFQIVFRNGTKFPGYEGEVTVLVCIQEMSLLRNF